MKANEAPEKIYIFDNPILDFTRLSIRQSSDDIEYTRIDAFIEKAEKYLKSRLLRYIDYCERGVGVSTEEFIDSFVNYMKGE